MKLEVDDILHKVKRHEEEMGEYRRMAEVWESMWKLKAFSRTSAEAEAAGQEQFALPLPYNVVNLLMRLIADDPKIDCPARDLSEYEVNVSERKERWLASAWQLAAQQQRTNLVSNAKWQSGVRAMHCFEVKWIRDELPEKLKDKRFPILVRNLDPLNVGISQGPLYTEFAYHKYDADPLDVAQRYPKAKKDLIDDTPNGYRAKRRQIPVVDYWYTDTDGTVWNAVLANEKYVKKPYKTDYSVIPIIVGGADVSMSKTPSHRSLSILHPLVEIWPAMSRLASQIATANLWYFWPHIAVQNENGMELPENLVVKPGVTQPYPWGTKIEMIQMNPNVPLAGELMSQYEKAAQESTFPGVMYGQAPGSLQAGYGVSILSNAAEGRISSTRYNLERTIEAVDELMLRLVEEFAPDDGVRVWGMDKANSKILYETLTPDEIDGYYENHVTLQHTIPQNDIQVQTLGLRLVDSGIVSRQWYRDKMINAPISADEAQNVLTEQLMEDPQLKPKLMLAALAKRFPDSWESLVEGTELQKLLEPPQPEPPPQPMGVPPPMNGQMPPMPQGMPPDMMAPPGAQMPPGMMGMGQGPQSYPPGMGMPPQVPGQFDSLNMDGGTFPPMVGGQLSPQTMGFPPGMPPELIQQLLGRPMTPGEELNSLGGT